MPGLGTIQSPVYSAQRAQAVAQMPELERVLDGMESALEQLEIQALGLFRPIGDPKDNIRVARLPQRDHIPPILILFSIERVGRGDLKILLIGLRLGELDA